MTRMTKVIVALAGALLTASAWAQMPSNQPAAPSGSLPAGHPDISQMVQSPIPSGAAGSATPGRMNLPAGHPDISKMQLPTTQPNVVGTLLVRATQATKNGPAIGEDPFVAEFYVRGRLLERIEGKLGPDGTTRIEGVPLPLAPTPVVKITHAGVEYQASGQAFDASSTARQIEVPVYESTTDEPAWQVKMQHVMVERVAGGLQVVEMLAIDNPSDRAWTGKPGPDGRPVTFSVQLPEGSTHVRVISGLHDCCTTIDGNTLSNTMALNPGTTQYQFSYLLPATNGTARISTSATAKVQHLMVFVPDDGTTVQTTDFEASGSADMGQGRRRFYKATEVEAGKVLALDISGIADAPATSSRLGSDSATMAKFIAGAGAALILLFAVAILLKGSGRKVAKA